MKRHLIEYVAYGSVVTCVGLDILLFASMWAYSNEYVLARLIAGIACLSYLIASAYLAKKRHYLSSAIMLVVFYYLVAAASMLSWGLNAPIALLCMAFVLLLAIIGLGSRFMLPMTLLICLTLASVTTLDISGFINPDESSLANQATVGDALGYCAIFGIFAVLSFLASRRLELALSKSRQSEKKLKSQRNSIRSLLNSRTNQLSSAAIAEIRQATKFEELGQVAASTLHDLANALNVLSLDIDDIVGSKDTNASREINSSLNNLKYLLRRFRSYLVDNRSEEYFDPIEILKSSVSKEAEAYRRENKLSLRLHFNQTKALRLKGDSFRFKQVISVVLGNATKALSSVTYPKKLDVECSIVNSRLVICVRDNGPGIPKKLMKNLFIEPVPNQSGSGLGIGLLITKEIMTSHFSGDIKVDSSPKDTRVTLTFPLSS